MRGDRRTEPSCQSTWDGVVVWKPLLKKEYHWGNQTAPYRRLLLKEWLRLLSKNICGMKSYSRGGAFEDIEAVECLEKRERLRANGEKVQPPYKDFEAKCRGFRCFI